MCGPGLVSHEGEWASMHGCGPSSAIGPYSKGGHEGHSGHNLAMASRVVLLVFFKCCGCIYVGKSIPVDTQPLRDIYSEGTKLTTWQCLTVNCHNSSRNGR